MVVLLGCLEWKNWYVQARSCFSLVPRWTMIRLWALGHIMRSSTSSNDCTSINIFRPPLPEENINSLAISCLFELVQVVQTTEVAEVRPSQIIDVSFVIPYMTILDDSNMLEVTGMELVRVLRCRVQNGIFEEVLCIVFPLTMKCFTSATIPMMASVTGNRPKLFYQYKHS